MKPISFPEQTTVFAEHQKEYTPLPAFVANDAHGSVVSCWKLSFKERLTLLFTGKLWVNLMMFGAPLTPSYFTVKKSDVLAEKGVYYLHRWCRIKVRWISYTTIRYTLELKVPFWRGRRVWVFAEKTDLAFNKEDAKEIYGNVVLNDYTAVRLIEKRRMVSLQNSERRRVILRAWATGDIFTGFERTGV